MAYLDKSIIKVDPKLEDKSNYLAFVDQSNGMLELKTDSGILYNPVSETLIIQNLSVNGTTTTVNTETINLADNIITLNSNIGDTATPTENGGIEIKRGIAAAAILRWNEADDRWEFTNNGTTYSKMLVSGEYVKSVGLSLPTSVFSVSGSPVTDSGTLTGTFKTQAKNTFFAGPTTGNDAVPTFRTIIAADLPNASVSTSGVVTVGAQEFGGTKTFRSAATQDGISLQGRAGGTASYDVILTPTTLTADRTITLPDKTGTLALLTDITSGTSNKVANSLTVLFDTGIVEDTDKYTFDGSSAKTIDIKAGSNVTLTKTAGAITISSINTNTTYSPGTALDLNGTTFNVDLSELISSTTDSDGAYFVVVAGSADGSDQRKLQKSSINLSGFNNDSGWTSNTGTVTSVNGTGTVSGLTLSGTVTTTGSLTLGGTLTVTPSNFASQTKKTFLASPNAADGRPSFREIISADLPIASISASGIVSTSAQEFLGDKTFRSSATTNGITIKGNATVGGYEAILIPPILTSADVILTLPDTTGTLIGTGDTGTVTNLMLAGSIANSKLVNSTISGVSLGSNLNTLTIGTGLTGTSYNGSSAVTIAISTAVATLTGTQTFTNKTLTSPIIDNIKGSVATATVDLWSEVTIGSITIGAGLTTGTLNLGAAGTSATNINIGHTGASTTLSGNVILPTGSTKIGKATLQHDGVTDITITLPTTTGTLYISGGTDVAVADGGTGKSSWSTGAVYATGATTLTSGTLPISAGGTGATSTVIGGIVYGSSATAYATTAVGTTGQILKSNGVGKPTWVNPSSLDVGTAGTADQVANSLILKFDTGTTEGTNKYTFNGSSAKTIDIQAGQGIALTAASGVVTISNIESMVTRTLAYTPGPTDSIILCDSTSATFKVTLPTNVPSGTIYRIKKIDSSTNPVTIDATTGKTIDGAQTFDLQYQYQAIDVVFNGSSVWYIL